MHFEVVDLTADDRFKNLPFVAGEPHFRYYCGVPLKTKNGVNIGSLFALDDKVRSPINIKQLQCKMANVKSLVLANLLVVLETIANICMAHFEATKAKEDMKRIKSMNLCLAAFVDPDHRVRRTSRKRGANSSSVSVRSAKSSASLVTKYDEDDNSKVKNEPMESLPQPKSPTSNKKNDLKQDSDDYTATFNIAAALLAKSLGLVESSGVVLLDTSSQLNHVTQDELSTDSSEDDFVDSRRPKARRASGTHGTRVSYKSFSGSIQYKDQSRAEGGKGLPSEVLSTSCIHTDLGPPVSSEFQYSPLSQMHLARYIKKYPRGMLFNMEDKGNSVSGSSGEERMQTQLYPLPQSRHVIPSDSELAILSQHFPGARQVIFVPVWNPSSARFSACFAINTSEFRELRRSPEFLHTIAFCNCATIEITRIATVAADQQKSDFIGSISHELRSPLHGILASCEFLDDTELSSFQKSLVDTADGCARTLLDTINMVLDYSKINAFERTASKGRKKRHQNISTSHLQPAMNILGDVDLAAITEEVVEGVATGQVFKDRLADVDSTDLHDTSPRDIDGKSGVSSLTPKVEIILDIPPGNWMFLTQPGAFRRVVMNVFGNSLKYTAKGFIHISLKAEPVQKEPTDDEGEETAIVTLTIKDSGQGISPQYMKTKLFTPFAQESSIAPGTGLGLSLVRTIVRMLHGDIDIKSTLGVGTEVNIKFPMSVGTAGGSKSGSLSNSDPNSSGSIERTKDDSLVIVTQRAKGKTALYYRPRNSTTDPEIAKLAEQAIGRYLREWYNFTLANPLSEARIPNVIIVAQSDLPTLLREVPAHIKEAPGTTVVVISPSSNPRFDREDQGFDNVESISYPFGPYKLAKVIRLCLDNVDKADQADSTILERPEADDGEDELTEVIQSVDQVRLGGDMNVVQQGQMMANEEYAPLMVEALSAMSSRSLEQSSGYPFPADIHQEYAPQASQHAKDLLKHQEQSDKSQPTSPRVTSHARPPPTPKAPTGTTSRAKDPRSPRLLLVDDNNVNLRLLHTFMKKRGYSDIHMAENGAISVAKYKAMASEDPPHPPDIIMMDLSMPIMNGFEATRQIREIECNLREPLSPTETPPTSMIIALTGLASSRDQSEAFTSGFDLYLVKPISFKSIAKLLDSWERNGGAATVGVPHGSLSGEDVTSGTTKLK